MLLYKVEIVEVRPENVEAWSSLYPEQQETFTIEASRKVVTYTTDPLSDLSVKFAMFFYTEQEWIDYLAYRETIPEYQHRQAYETANGITRTVVSQAYVDV